MASLSRPSRPAGPGASAYQQGVVERRAQRHAARRTAGWVLGAIVGLALAVLLRRIGARWATTGSDAVAVVASSMVLIAWVIRPRPDPDRWFRGAAGEQATARMLDRLGRHWVVRHDLAVPGSRANIDHVVIGPTGVWVIDTKAYRAPMRPGWRSVRVGGHRLDTDAASWEAQVVADRLGVATTPVVAVHGTGLPPRGRVVGAVRVIPADRLVGHLCRRSLFRWLVRLADHRSGGGRLGRSQVAELARRLDGAFVPAVGGDATDWAQGWQDASLARRASSSGPPPGRSRAGAGQEGPR